MSDTTNSIIDWNTLTEEATDLLSEYLRVDTINPPGNETRAAKWFGEILDAEGIEYEMYGPTESRQSLVAKLEGDG